MVEPSPSWLMLASFIFASESESLSVGHGAIFVRQDASVSSFLTDVFPVVSSSSSLVSQVSPGSKVIASSSPVVCSSTS